MILLLLFVVATTFVIFSWINLILDAKRFKIPGPFPLPVIGNGNLFLEDSTSMLNVFKYFAEKNTKGLTRFYILSNRYLLVSEPEFVEALTSNTDFITKGRSYTFLYSWLGEGLLTSTGNKWKTHRKFLTPAFHFNILQNFLPIFLKNGQVLKKKLESKADGRAIDLFPIIALASLDNVTESIMGVSVNAQTDSESEYVQSIKAMGVVVAYRMRNLFASLEPLFKLMSMKKTQDKALEVLHRQSRKVIETRQKELQKLNMTSLNYDSDFGIKNKYAFLDLLLLAEIEGKKIDEESVREEVDTFMFEGHDTTTSGIVFSLYCIANNKGVQEKILAEQKNILGDSLDREPSYSDFAKMKYLDLVIKESLRLYPAVPLFERLINRDTVMAGYHIPKNTSILIDVLNLHRNPKLFENPLEFCPARFESNKTRHPFSWIPFSAGPRNCIGQKFALLAMKTTISTIVKHFKLFPAGPEPILGAELVLVSSNGVHIGLEAR